MAPSSPNPSPNPDAIFDALISNRNDPAALRKRVETLEILLERSFVIPGINRPVGLDAIVGLIPVVGDVIAATMGAYLIWEARNLGMPKWKIRSEEHTSELQSLMRISYAVFCLTTNKTTTQHTLN